MTEHDSPPPDRGPSLRDRDPPPRDRARLRAAVFCGSRFGARPEFAAAIRALGAELAARGIGLIYGGSRIGLMGLLADAVLDAGGEVTGIIPGFLSAREIPHARVADLVVTDSMHSRKREMFARADVFITMPGGLGTLDETVEIVTWRQLGLHDKPVLIVDIGGWARHLLAAFAAAVTDGLAGPETAGLYEVFPDIAALLARLERISPAASGDAAGAGAGAQARL